MTDRQAAGRQQAIDRQSDSRQNKEETSRQQEQRLINFYFSMMEERERAAGHTGSRDKERQTD